MNTKSFEHAIGRISESLINKDKTESINIQTFGRNDADTGSFYFYQFEGEFKNAKANGLCKSYNECGTLIQEGVFLDGNPIVIYDYSSSGNKACFYTSDGQKIEKELPKTINSMRGIEHLETINL